MTGDPVPAMPYTPSDFQPRHYTRDGCALWSRGERAYREVRVQRVRAQQQLWIEHDWWTRDTARGVDVWHLLRLPLATYFDLIVGGVGR